VEALEANKKILGWLNKNRHLLKPYEGKYIAFNDRGIIAHGDELENVQKAAKASNEPFLIYIVPHRAASIVIYSIL
jgi:hypothetical protein